ncbi:hypothetical protein [Imbroritus primus]|uniref:hypothetical protein n=1 Tax=Imbroritus primus TaxID=3058603 RepID=UPI003D161BEE
MKTWNAYTPAEDRILRRQWKSPLPMKEWLHLLPGRTYRSVISRAQYLKLGPRKAFVYPCYSPTWDAVKRVLATNPGLDSIQISQMTGASRRAVMTALQVQHAAGEVHVPGYGPRPPSGYAPKLWALGPGKDAPRPKPMTASQKAKRSYRRLKQERPDILAKKSARAKLTYAERNGKLIRRDPAAAWIQGVA